MPWEGSGPAPGIEVLDPRQARDRGPPSGRSRLRGRHRSRLRAVSQPTCCTTIHRSTTMDSNCSGRGFHIASFLLQEGRFAGSTVKALLLVRGVPMMPEGKNDLFLWALSLATRDLHLPGHGLGREAVAPSLPHAAAPEVTGARSRSSPPRVTFGHRWRGRPGHLRLRPRPKCRYEPHSGRGTQVADVAGSPENGIAGLGRRVPVPRIRFSAGPYYGA